MMGASDTGQKQKTENRQTKTKRECFLFSSGGSLLIPSGASAMEPEDRHRLCWYSRRTVYIPADIGFHTIVDGELLYCAHPMLFPIVGYGFDVQNCTDCEYFRARRDQRGTTVPEIGRR
jgi:hypothetical protein